MSAATDGFSAMMSFLPMRRKAADDKCKRAPASTTGASWRTRGLARQPGARRAEEILRHQAARGRLLIPHHHQHDQLELLARLRSEDARVLERHEEAAALSVELRDLAQRERAERSLRVGQGGEAGVRP